MGMKDLNFLFEQSPNVILNRFLPENEMRLHMQKAHVSLSVFDDMVASNVITTSLACGLPQVVSDEGSVRDYCSEKDTIFCRTTEDFIEGIHRLREDEERRIQMGRNARQKAEEISLEKSIQWYRNFFEYL